MNESLRLPVNPATERININEISEINKWCNEFNISPQELKIAIIEVGSRIINVENFIRNKMNVIF